MRTIKFLLCIFVLVTLVCGCGKPGSSETRESFVKIVKVDKRSYEAFDMSVVVSVGNHSYIPLNFWRQAGVGNDALYIMGILNAFEEAHPNLEITNWCLEATPHTNFIPNFFIFGIWVDHHPRQS